MSSGISKGGALIALSEQLDMDLKAAVVFGDNYNDASMFKVAGLSVVVANAEPNSNTLQHISLCLMMSQGKPWNI